MGSKGLPSSHINYNTRSESERLTVSYDFWMRTDALKTCSSVVLLTLGICNFCFSFIFALGFQRYHESYIDTVDCEIAGALSLLSYSVFLVMPTGIFCLTIYALVAFYKLSHLVTSLLCPLALIRIKHRWIGIPVSKYERFSGEFNFEVDITQ